MLGMLVRKGLSGRVTSMWRPARSDWARYLWQESSRQSNSKCKGPEVGLCLMGVKKMRLVWME